MQGSALECLLVKYAAALADDNGCAAACQRNLEQRYPGLEVRREEYAELVQSFHAEHIASSFPIPDYVMDVYITASGRVSVVAIHFTAT